MKTTREHLNIIDAFHQLGSYRAAARLCGTTHKTVIDRLLHHSVVVVTEGESFRLREARSRGGERLKT